VRAWGEDAITHSMGGGGEVATRRSILSLFLKAAQKREGQGLVVTAGGGEQQYDRSQGACETTKKLVLYLRNRHIAYVTRRGGLGKRERKRFVDVEPAGG